jgi:mono/diheme cytochrome c family protein
MARLSVAALKRHLERATARRRGLLFGGVLASAMLLTACAVEVQNRQATQDLAQLAKPPGSVYLGWRVFQDKCARCHGLDATGAGGGPNLLPRVRGMGPHQFVSAVIRRYDWELPAAQASSEGAAREALIEKMVRREEYALAMPEWGGEPRVSAHVVDLYAYLSARADGSQPPGRPLQ